MPAPSVGRIVHYVLGGSTANPGECRPAIIVKVWDRGDDNPAISEEEAGDVELQLFTNGPNDGLENVESVHGCSHDENRSHGTWHWPPRT